MRWWQLQREREGKRTDACLAEAYNFRLTNAINICDRFSSMPNKESDMLCHSKAIHWTVALALTLGVLCSASHAQEEALDLKATDAQIKKLQLERIELLKDSVQVADL